VFEAEVGVADRAAEVVVAAERADVVRKLVEARYEGGADLAARPSDGDRAG
jgi:hypothetical protein